jgi:hypothetical protein
MKPDLPPALGTALRPTLPDLAAETIAAIGEEVPDYARPLEGPFGRALRMGVERALARFVDSVERPSEPPDAADAEIYRALGRAEQRGGRTLEALLSAYRLGARLAWERFVAAGEAAGHDPATLYRLAAAIFTYIDAISAESIEGYTDEQARGAGERQQRRRALAVVLARADVPAGEVAEIASLAGWRRPASVAALVASGESGAPDADRLASRLGPEAVAATVDRAVVAFVADPGAPGRRAQLEAAVDGAAAVLGPEVPLARSAASLRRARAAHDLVLEGRLPPAPLTVADEHLAALVLTGGDPSAARDLAARVLAPLEPLAAGARLRLHETLRAWLDRPGQVQRVAAELHVHPQTVRYRLGQLRELFGEALDDPEARFELALALRASR